MMIFRRKPQNRRAEKNRVLHVKASTRQRRAMFLRVTATALGVSLGTLAALFGIWQGGDWLLDKLVYKNDSFALRDLEISTDGGLPISAIQTWADVKIGDNLFSLDLTRIQRNLEWVPQIQKVALERILPGALKIRVTEREPIARVTIYSWDREAGAITRKVYWLDSGGWAMAPISGLPGWSEESQNLPQLTGVLATEVRPGFQSDSAQVREALNLVERFENSPMFGLVDLASVDVGEPGVLTLETAQGSAVTFSPEDVDRQLQRWRLVYDYATGAGKAIATLDLSVRNNVPAQWLNPNLVPAVPFKPTVRHRRTHV